jgi:quercetin dioxygenase-like cupin family protein
VKYPVYGDRRPRSFRPGIETRHCFSAEPAEDAIGGVLGPIVAVDEHLVEPGAGFDWRSEGGRHFAYWVLEGTLRFEAHGPSRFVTPGALFVVSTGTRLRHCVNNASSVEPLRFLEIEIDGVGDLAFWTSKVPTTVAGVRVTVGRHFPPFPGLALILRGRYNEESVERFTPGYFMAWDIDPTMIYEPETDDALVLGLTLAP